MQAKHSNEINPCPSCEEKLKTAHPDLAAWFHEVVKPLKPDAHISWAFRDKADQTRALADGKSKLAFPMSPHNKSDDQGNPCSLALDLFRLCSNGMASWEYLFFKDVAQASPALAWGGEWKSLGDSDHYQIGP